MTTAAENQILAKKSLISAFRWIFRALPDDEAGLPFCVHPPRPSGCRLMYVPGLSSPVDAFAIAEPLMNDGPGAVLIVSRLGPAMANDAATGFRRVDAAAAANAAKSPTTSSSSNNTTMSSSARATSFSLSSWGLLTLPTNDEGGFEDKDAPPLGSMEPRNAARPTALLPGRRWNVLNLAEDRRTIASALLTCLYIH